MKDGFMILFLIICGLFAILGGVMNWDFFFNNYKAKPFVKLLGRNGARVFYIFLGVFVIFCGIMTMLPH